MVCVLAFLHCNEALSNDYYILCDKIPISRPTLSTHQQTLEHLSKMSAGLRGRDSLFRALMSSKVLEPACKICNERAVIYYKECMPKEFLCSECDVRVHALMCYMIGVPFLRGFITPCPQLQLSSLRVMDTT